VIFYRKALLTLVFALLFVGLVGGCGGGGGQAGGGAGGNKQLNIGYINWDEDVAVSNVAKILLEEKLGYDVKLTLAEVGPLYSGVAGGDIDAFLDVWLPNTHKTYWEQYQNQVVDLGRWYEGTASLGLGVPDYVEAQSIEDLNKYRDEFGGKIIGIEPGAGIMRIAEDNAIPGYGLDYELVASSTPAMISELEKAMNNQQPIVFTAWKPHWMFTAYNIRYLEDPKGEMGTPEELSAITRTGLEQDAPEAFKFLGNISLTEEQLGDLELAIRDAGDPEQGARDWLEKNRELADSWLPGGS
jgi:glycine betaine/proline transport system substrate-binding protein